MLPIIFPSYTSRNGMPNSKPMGAVGSIIAIITLAALTVAAAWFVIWVCIG